MFPRYVYQSCDGKTTTWILVDNKDDHSKSINDGWSKDIPSALEAYNNSGIESAGPKRRGRPPKVVK
jgi:hypothetical protein